MLSPNRQWPRQRDFVIFNLQRGNLCKKLIYKIEKKVLHHSVSTGLQGQYYTYWREFFKISPYLWNDYYNSFSLLC